MLKATKVVIVASAVLLIAGSFSCGSTTESGPDNSNLVSVPKRNDNANPYASNGSSNVVMYNGAKNINANVTRDNSQVRKVDTNSVETKIPSRKMADGSEVFTEMNKKGVVIETRVFKGNMYLDKIVKTTVSADDVTMKIYLKGGEVKEIPPGKFGNFRTIPASDVLSAIGINPAPKPKGPQIPKAKQKSAQ